MKHLLVRFKKGGYERLKEIKRRIRIFCKRIEMSRDNLGSESPESLIFTEEKNLVLKEELTRARKGITTQRERGLPQ